MILLILATALSTIVYFFLKLNYQYWEKRGVKGPKPVPIIGNLGKSAIFQDTNGNVYTNIYRAYKNEEVVGIYRGTSPVLLIRDPEVIKEITVKSFSHFHDNDVYLDKKVDPLLGRSPFMLKGEEWKVVRSQLTPGFTSGKMKWLYPLLEETSATLVKFLDNCPKIIRNEGYEAKDLCVRFTLNNVASCAFGLEGKCLEEEESNFWKLSREFMSPDGWSVFGFALLTMFPFLSKFLPIRIVTKDVEKKLFKMVADTLKYRKENNVVRNDFLHIMTQLKETSKEYTFTDLDVTAQAAGFFGDGSETSSIVMSWTLFEIAANPDAQAKLQDEVNGAFGKDGALSYEALQGLEYLDAVINESLRLHPPILFLQKSCTEPFGYTSKSGNPSFTIEKDTTVILPMAALQRDAKYYDDPDSFKPERFLDHNKENLTKYTYFPFGEGPRACLGKRFGVLQIKIGIAYIIKNFEMSVNKKTKLPIKYLVNAFTLAEGGLWLDFKKINK